jgi:hypothetical protein
MPIRCSIQGIALSASMGPQGSFARVNARRRSAMARSAAPHEPAPEKVRRDLASRLYAFYIRRFVRRYRFLVV